MWPVLRWGAVAFVLLVCGFVGCRLGPALPAEECSTDGDCDDALFCNGAEHCLEGSCVGTDSPCPPIGDCVVCDEATDSCATLCVLDADCDNGDPIDGAEFCDGCVCHSATGADLTRVK